MKHSPLRSRRWVAIAAVQFQSILVTCVALCLSSAVRYRQTASVLQECYMLKHHPFIFNEDAGMMHTQRAALGTTCCWWLYGQLVNA